MPTLKVTREWASDWADKFDQSWTPARLSELVGKTVKGERPVEDGEEQRGFRSAFVVGYSVDTLVFQPDDDDEATSEVYRYSLIVDGEKQFPLLAGLEITEVEE